MIVTGIPEVLETSLRGVRASVLPLLDLLLVENVAIKCLVLKLLLPLLNLKVLDV